MKSKLVGKMLLLALIAFAVWSIATPLVEKNKLESHKNFIVKPSIEASETIWVDIITPYEEIKGYAVSYWSIKEGTIMIELLDGRTMVVGGDFIVTIY